MLCACGTNLPTVQTEAKTTATGSTNPAASKKIEQESRYRSEKDINRTLRANHNTIHTAYQRGLRRNPLLKGKTLFHIVIEPDGSVSECSIISSGLGRPKLERELVQRIKHINFGAEDVETTATDFPITFLP